jgi:hypothetical protein
MLSVVTVALNQRAAKAREKEKEKDSGVAVK